MCNIYFEIYQYILTIYFPGNDVLCPTALICSLWASFHILTLGSNIPV